MAEIDLTVYERRFGEQIYATVEKNQLQKTMDLVSSARENMKSRVGDKGYLVEASIRRILDTQGGLLGYTPAILAAENGYHKVLKYLLDTGASELAVDSVGTTMLHAAASAGRLACIEVLVRKVNVDQKDKRGDTALHWACSRGNLEVVKLLTTNGATVNAKNNSGATPIFNACYNGHYEAVDYLIQKGASLSLQNMNGDTPLHIAISFNQLSIVDSLIKSGARADLKNKDGKIAVEMSSNAAVLEVLPSTEPEKEKKPSLKSTWKASFSLPVPSLNMKQMEELSTKLVSTQKDHLLIEPKQLLRSLQGSLDKLSWWRFEQAFDGSDTKENASEEVNSMITNESAAADGASETYGISHVVTNDDLPYLQAYLRFSSQCGVDVRPLTLDIRVEDDESTPGAKLAYFLVPLQASLLKPRTGSKIMFCQRMKFNPSSTDDEGDSQFLTIGTGSVGKSFMTTTTTLSAATGERARKAAMEELKKVNDSNIDNQINGINPVLGDGDSSTDVESKIVFMDMSQKLLEENSASVAIMIKKFDPTTGQWKMHSENIPGFSKSGAPLIVCRSFVVENGPPELLKQKGISVLAKVG